MYDKEKIHNRIKDEETRLTTKTQTPDKQQKTPQHRLFWAKPDSHFALYQACHLSESITEKKYDIYQKI